MGQNKTPQSDGSNLGRDACARSLLLQRAPSAEKGTKEGTLIPRLDFAVQQNRPDRLGVTPRGLVRDPV